MATYKKIWDRAGFATKAEGATVYYSKLFTHCHNAILDSGVTATTDTGQIDFATFDFTAAFTAAGSTSTIPVKFGYKVYEVWDGVFLKIVYGARRTNSQYRGCPVTEMFLGVGTDGAGNLTNQVTCGSMGNASIHEETENKVDQNITSIVYRSEKTFYAFIDYNNIAITYGINIPTLMVAVSKSTDSALNVTGQYVTLQGNDYLNNTSDANSGTYYDAVPVIRTVSTSLGGVNTNNDNLLCPMWTYTFANPTGAINVMRMYNPINNAYPEPLYDQLVVPKNSFNDKQVVKLKSGGNTERDFIVLKLPNPVGQVTRANLLWIPVSPPPFKTSWTVAMIWE